MTKIGIKVLDSGCVFTHDMSFVTPDDALGMAEYLTERAHTPAWIANTELVGNKKIIGQEDIHDLREVRPEAVDCKYCRKEVIISHNLAWRR